MSPSSSDLSRDPPGIHREPRGRPGGPRRAFGFLRRVAARSEQDHLQIVAAGVAFYGLLGVFPAIAALAALYGLLLDPQEVARQIQALQGMLPEQAIRLLADHVPEPGTSERRSLGIGAAGALLLALWSASTAMRALIDALNLAYDVAERRSFLGRAALSLVFTVAAICSVIVALAGVVVLPAALDLVRPDPALRDLLAYGRWPLIAAFAWLGLLLVYRFGPHRRDARWSWRDPGAMVAIAAWLGGSLLFSWYVESFAGYDRTYGSLGAVVVLLMWFLLSAYAVLIGAEINAELECGRADDGPAEPAR